MKNYFLTFVCLLFLYSCSNEDTNENPSEEAEISIIAINFLNEVIGIMESNSLNRNTIDWSEFRNDVFNLAGTAQSIDDLYDSGVLERALALLGDNHSFIRRLNGQVISASTLTCSAPEVNVGSLSENIGYVRVESYIGYSNQPL